MWDWHGFNNMRYEWNFKYSKQDITYKNRSVSSSFLPVKGMTWLFPKVIKINLNAGVGTGIWRAGRIIV